MEESREKLVILFRREESGGIFANIVARNIARTEKIPVPGKMEIEIRTETVTETRVEVKGEPE